MLRLRWSPSSPFARKVVVVAAEAGVLDQIEIVPTSTAEPSPEFMSDNPLAKIPVLALEDGMTLFDSRVICEYLDALGSRALLFPREGPQRWRALCQQATADGLADAALLIRYELRRPQLERSSAWVSSQQDRITRALSRMAADDLGPTPTIGLIASAVALGYLDFRFSDLDWRSAHPQLASWYEMFSRRTSMTASVPREKQ